MEKIKKKLYNIEKTATKNKVKNISHHIEYKKSIIKNNLTTRVKNRVDIAFKIATNIYNKNKDKKTQQEIKIMIKNALEALVWNDGENFIWIIDYDGIFYLAPKYLKKLEGSSIINLKDALGRLIIQEEIAICKEKGEGFLWNTFTKPTGIKDKQYKQVASVKDFGNYNWYFGSSEYLDTATKKSNKKLLNTIKKIDEISSHYIFIITTSGDILINTTIPNFEGKNISEIDDKKTKNIVAKIQNLIKNKQEASYSYKWINPKNNKTEKKYSYIQKIPNTNWIIGSGFYLSSIEEKLSKKRISMYELFYSESKSILYISILIIILFLFIAYYISKKLQKSFIKYETNIDKKNTQLIELNDTLENKVKERTAELEKMKNKLEILATIDVLTNIHNRYSLMKILDIEISRSRRHNTPLSIIMYDIDYFKKVNDIYGHDIGDKVLTSLSSVVKNNIRDIDIVGRYGGEEFLIILPDTTLEDAKYYADRLRKKVEQYKFNTVGHITISLGLVELKDNESLDEVFKRVDDLLYKSKNDGRNRVSF
ncbi:MAG: cache domain-containing protein [Sulfurimonas sp.]|nr:cache domain-containing protein [Sulfurimonas sp.]